MTYIPKYRPQFAKDVKRYAGLKSRIEKKVLSILKDPYHNTEPLEDRPGHHLKGIRSKRVDRNFRILFSICEECQKLFSPATEAKPCRYCEPSLHGTTVIFFTVRPHKKVYKTDKPVG